MEESLNPSSQRSKASCKHEIPCRCCHCTIDIEKNEKVGIPSSKRLSLTFVNSTCRVKQPRSLNGWLIEIGRLLLSVTSLTVETWTLRDSATSLWVGGRDNFMPRWLFASAILATIWPMWPWTQRATQAFSYYRHTFPYLKFPQLTKLCGNGNKKQIWKIITNPIFVKRWYNKRVLSPWSLWV